MPRNNEADFAAGTTDNARLPAQLSSQVRTEVNPLMRIVGPPKLPQPQVDKELALRRPEHR
jgi:hypothetical protein